MVGYGMAGTVVVSFISCTVDERIALGARSSAKAAVPSY